MEEGTVVGWFAGGDGRVMASICSKSRKLERKLRVMSAAKWGFGTGLVDGRLTMDLFGRPL